MITTARVTLGTALILASATLLNRYAPGELLQLVPEELGVGSIEPDILEHIVAELSVLLTVRNCLPRAIALREVLRKNGVDATVVISATYKRGFWGHAWVHTPNHGCFFVKEGLVPWLILPLDRQEQAI